MRKILSLILLLAVSATASSQEYKEELKKEFNRFSQATANKEFDVVISYLPEQFFQYVSREDMLTGMEQALNNPAFTISYQPVQFVNISDEEVEDKTRYVLFVYNQTYILEFLRQEDETDDAYQSRMQAAQTMFSQSIDGGTVTYDPQKNHFAVNESKEVYAIFPEKGSGWKFITKDAQTETIVHQIVPEAVRLKIK